MSHDRQGVRRIVIGCARPLLAAALLLGLNACGKQSDPLPSQSPRPVTLNWGGGSVHTADMQLSVRPVPVSPGEM